MATPCQRLYPDEYPQVGDLVIVKIREISQDNIYVHLLEYDKEGMVPLSEISRKQIRNIKKFVHIGAQECMEVIEVDTGKGYIDLTRKQIKDINKEQCKEKFTNVRRIHSFFNRWGKNMNVNLIENVLWKYYTRSEENPYAEIMQDYNWMELIAPEYHERLKEDFIKIFESSKAVKHEIAIEMACYSINGVQLIQRAIDNALTLSTTELPLQCIYTGKKGAVGTIFQLCVVTKNDPTVLQQAVTKIKEILVTDTQTILVIR